jgi:hypothetical protein
MGLWYLRALIVALLGLAALSTWHFGKEFNSGLEREHVGAAAKAVPPDALAKLSGQTLAKQDTVPVRLVNTTVWHLTVVTLALETVDKADKLTTEITQNFRDSPWAPGDAIERGIALAANWNGRPVRYAVISAQGFQ